jgi:integration host factor subunit alpha
MAVKDAIKRDDLAELLYERYRQLKKEECRDIVDTIFNKMRELLVTGHDVYIWNLGLFEQRYVRSKPVGNFKPGEVVMTRPRNKIHFRPVASLRDIK